MWRIASSPVVVRSPRSLQHLRGRGGSRQRQRTHGVFVYSRLSYRWKALGTCSSHLPPPLSSNPFFKDTQPAAHNGGSYFVSSATDATVSPHPPPGPQLPMPGPQMPMPGPQMPTQMPTPGPQMLGPQMPIPGPQMPGSQQTSSHNDFASRLPQVGEDRWVDVTVILLVGVFWW